ncbi:AAA family ATPase [Tindallia californiensis]|uniref:ATPase family associated with various cellular activities (AAA) n=1 Tax=Tindallia californiensis TaxID=159292 RepID=A0A1H3RD96_9FIRM|nr:ATP-binding protein [Tindallia californiensis]SDZ23523.1 ATPase family associated with various cellular activities (AAA) [Tindallia californiensis]
MASGDSLIKLFKSFKENNQVEFTKIAHEIIEDEKKKNHYLLADKLHKILFDNNYSSTLKNRSLNSKQLPVDKESGFQLLEMKFTKLLLDDIILTLSNKEKIQEIINEFEHKEILETYKLYPKTKILFCGPPGCGKTMTAEAIANELQLPLLYTRFDSVISSFLGETSTNLRKIFDFAKEGEWVLFFDEFDSIGKSRSLGSEHGELKRVVNGFLQLMDNFPKDKIIIAATNYETVIDKALWRRFDEIVVFNNPDRESIEKTVKVKLRNFHFDSLNIEKHLDDLVGLSFADIERICLEATKNSILKHENSITNDLFKKAVLKEKERKKVSIKP